MMMQRLWYCTRNDYGTLTILFILFCLLQVEDLHCAHALDATASSSPTSECHAGQGFRCAQQPTTRRLNTSSSSSCGGYGATCRMGQSRDCCSGFICVFTGGNLRTGSCGFAKPMIQSIRAPAPTLAPVTWTDVPTQTPITATQPGQHKHCLPEGDPCQTNFMHSVGKCCNDLVCTLERIGDIEGVCSGISSVPSSSPSLLPSSSPTKSAPSNLPSFSPSNIPTTTPSIFPTSQPSKMPSSQPSHIPSAIPSESPSNVPSRITVSPASKSILSSPTFSSPSAESPHGDGEMS